MLEKLFGEDPEVIRILRDDHRQVEKLFQEYDKAEDRASIAQAIIEALERHAKIEEKVVYPAFRELLDDKRMIDEAVQEHHLVHVLLRELKKLHVGQPTFEAKLVVLKELVQHHVEEEEKELFPKAEGGEIDWKKLAKRVESVRRISMSRKKRDRQGDPAPQAA